jgi:hypothetical protein
MMQPQSVDPIAGARAEWNRGRAWVQRGWAQYRRQPSFWAGAAFLYLFSIALIMRIPFAGFLVSVMLSPIVLAGVLLSLQRGLEIPAQEDKQRWLVQPARLLTTAFRGESHVYAVVLLGIVTLGLMVLVKIGEYLIGVGSVATLISTGATVSWWWLVPGGLLVLALNLALWMGLLYAPHRTMLAGSDPMQAVHESFVACRRHALAHAVYLVLLALPYLLVAWAFGVSAVLGYLLWFSMGMVVLPVFVLASYESYRDNYSDAALP